MEKEEGNKPLPGNCNNKQQGATGIYILICGFCFFCFLFFYLEKKKNGNFYDELLVSGWEGKRGRPEAWEANKKWVPNHVEQSPGSCLGPLEITGHFGMCVQCLISWSVLQTPMVHESWPHPGNVPKTNSYLTER